jgi:PII-like signaling protein
MQPSQTHSILRIYASTTDKVGMRPMYEHIVYLAREKGIAGVTVLRGVMGYGTSSARVHSSKFWELTEKLPVVIEMVDTTEKLEAFYEEIEQSLLEMKKGCMVVMLPVALKLMRSGRRDKN